MDDDKGARVECLTCCLLEVVYGEMHEIDDGQRCDSVNRLDFLSIEMGFPGRKF